MNMLEMHTSYVQNKNSLFEPFTSARVYSTIPRHTKSLPRDYTEAERVFTVRVLISIVMLLSIAAVCRAGDIGYFQSQSGQPIMLTDVPCTNKAGMLAHVSTQGGKVLFGCWIVHSDYIIIEYYDGDVYRYPGPALTLTPYGEQWLNSGTQSKPKQSQRF